MQIDDQWSNEVLGYELNEHASLVQSEIRDRLQAVMYATTSEGTPRHSNAAQESLLRAACSHRYDHISFHAATLATILCKQLELLLEILDPSSKASALKVRHVCANGEQSEHFRLNELGVEMTTSGQFRDEIKVSYRQMADSLIVLDLLVECCDFAELSSNLLSGSHTYQSLQQRANWIARTLDTTLAPHVDTKNLITKFQALIGFAQEQTGRNAHQILSSDITDDLIFDFWLKFSSHETLRVRLFRTAVDAWIDLYKTLVSSSHAMTDEIADPATEYDVEAQVYTLDRSEGMIDRWPTDCVERLIAQPDPLGKILLKSEGQTLLLALKCYPTRSKLWMTSIRLLTIGRAQHAWIESARRQQQPQQVVADELLMTTKAEVDSMQNALIDVEASICRLLVDIECEQGLPPCIELGRIILDSSPLKSTQIIPSNPVKQIIDHLDLEVEQQQNVGLMIEACIRRGKKNRRGTFSDYNALRTRCRAAAVLDGILSIYNDVHHLRKELTRLNVYLQQFQPVGMDQLRQDYDLAYRVINHL